MPPVPTERFLRRADLIGTTTTPGILNISGSTLWRLIRDGEFPAPVLVRGVRLWRASEIQDFLSGKWPAPSVTEGANHE